MDRWRKNRSRKLTRGVLFSLISILFSALFITLFSQNLQTSPTDQLPSSNIRVNVLDTYARDFRSYVGESIQVSTYSSLESITRNSGGFYLSEASFDSAFKYCMLTGRQSLNGPLCPSKAGYDLNSRITNITTLASSEMNINTTYAINSINITQTDPYDVIVTVNVSYNITDNSGNNYAHWERTDVVSEPVSILGLTDPRIYLNTTGHVAKYISEYTNVCAFNESCWNDANTLVFYNNNSYRYRIDAPGFLEMYWNSYAPSSCCGIETFLHPSQVWPIDYNSSFIDHYYWSGNYTCPAASNLTIYNISMGGDYISIDTATALRYGITTINLTNVLCKS